VVIPTYNRSAILASCLGALQHQSIEKDRYEVIVIDDGSTDATEELCRGFSAGFGFYYQRQQNRGAGAARNLGLNTAQGKYVLLVNDDTIASPTLLQEHLRAQASAAGKKLAVLGHFNYPAIAARRALTYLLSASPFLHPQVNMKKGLYHGMAYFIACNLSIEREAVLAAGSFDSQFRVAEGTEMGARMTCRGYQILYWPEAYAMHDHVNLRIDDFVRRARAYGPATLRLMQKHPSLLGDGGGLPGRLDRAGIIRTLDFLNNTRTQVTEALAVARRLDDFDFLPLLRGETEASKSLANAILGLLEKAVSQIHRFYLMEALVERLQDEELAPGDIKYSPQGRSDVLRPILEP
jgi:glycosyltransferase involved in cell wall biosynthesis